MSWKLEDPKLTGRPKKKYRCPSCNKPRRFTRYIDGNGNYAAPDFGYCDRVHNCGYHHRPDNSQSSAPHVIPLQPPRRFIDWSEIELEINPDAPLIAYLSSLYDFETVKRTLTTYKMGTDPQRPEYAVFTYVDKDQRLNRIKKQAYQPDGHRKKTAGATYTPKEYTVADGYLQVLFGLHLYDPQKITCVVESEKTALIAAMEYPEYTWMATGSMQNTKLIHDIPSAVLYPDKGKAYQVWNEKLAKGSYPCDPILETIDILTEGDDLADLIDLIK